MGLIIVALAALGYYGLMKYWQWADRNQGRFSQVVVSQPLDRHHDV